MLNQYLVQQPEQVLGKRKCDKQQRSLHSRFNIHSSHKYIYSLRSQQSVCRVTTNLPVHLITPGNMPTFQSQSHISPRPAHIECNTNKVASSCSHLTYSVYTSLFTSLHVYHTPPRLLNILIFKVRSDPGIASPGRFAWA